MTAATTATAATTRTTTSPSIPTIQEHDDQDRPLKKGGQGEDEGEGEGEKGKKEKGKGQDAGLRSLDHYRIRLPRWRYALREKMLPIVRWETPYVAWLQHSMRRPLLDTYFSMTANMGTHTFFMIILPVLFWCGQTRLGRGMATTLAAGVFFSGFLKDLLCLPRPLSPPLKRITMSGSVSLEYGFPSTHSTNAVSSAVYALFLLHESSSSSPDTPDTVGGVALKVLCYFYAFSIILGRLYCGMHGFFDVVTGTVLGAAIALVQIWYGDWFDTWLLCGPIGRLILVEIVILVLVRIHPEPADDCPCFDDSLAFAGVVMGCQAGGWHFARTRFSVDEPMPSTARFDLQRMGWLVVAARIMLGVTIVFTWRAIMKPTLLTVLPPIFRVVEHYGLTLPRRYFLPASQYKSVPAEQKYDDLVIPRARDIPSLLSNFRHRRRAISVGPQSEADAYEALAFREKKRRDSGSSTAAGAGAAVTTTGTSTFLRARANSLDEYKAQMGRNKNEGLLQIDTETGTAAETETGKAEEEERQQKELFAHLQKPRVRYDVEVITKLIVYSGIAWLAVEANPIIFELLGLGVR